MPISIPPKYVNFMFTLDSGWSFTPGHDFLGPVSESDLTTVTVT